MSVSASVDPVHAANARLMRRLLVVAAIMFGFGFALVPFYDKICQATGLRSLLQPDHVTAANTQVDLSRTVTVEFDTNTRGLAWTFKPLAGHIAVHPGELQQAVFEIRNNDIRPIVGQAIPSYGPALAAEYFKKVECFCFSQQALRPGEAKQVPVVFTVDPSLPKSVNVITLSFTFFEVNAAAVLTPGDGAAGRAERPL